MFLFLVPLILGFALNSASAFTSYYSQRFGGRIGKLVCVILRDVLGIPVWVTGYALAVMAPSPLLFKSTPGLSIFAWVLMVLGGLIICVGLWSLRLRAIAPSVQDTLINQGVYAYIRHPLYSGMLLELCGLFLWQPTLTVLIACLLGLMWVILQARLEELDLVQRLPAYKEYMQRVPRFMPRFR